MQHETDGAAQANPDLRVELAKAGALPEVPSRTNVAFVVTVSNVQAPTANSVLTRVTLPTGFTNLSTQPAPGTGFTCTIAGSVVWRSSGWKRTSWVPACRTAPRRAGRST